jgi:hypothetical protein
LYSSRAFLPRAISADRPEIACLRSTFFATGASVPLSSSLDPLILARFFDLLYTVFGFRYRVDDTEAKGVVESSKSQGSIGIETVELVLDIAPLPLA